MLNNLTLISTDDLVNELCARHDALVISGIKFTKTNGDYVILRRRLGNRLVCVGLLDTLKSIIVEEELNMQYKLSDDDKGDV